MFSRRIAFLGLGAMGFPMVNRLCDAGYTLQTAPYLDDPQFDDEQKAAYLKQKGVEIKDSFWQAIEGADLIISILPEDREVLEVYTSSDFAACVKQNAIILEMTSCSPQTIHQLADFYKDKNVCILDTPVSGGVVGAQNGKLTLFGSGEKTCFERIRPIMEVFGEHIYWTGEAGNGKALKAVNQMLTAVHMLALSEGFEMAKNLNIDPEIMLDVISKSSGSSYVIERKFKNMLDNNYLAGFKLSLMRKDLRTALSSVNELDLPVSRLAYKLYEDACQFDDFDYSAIYKAHHYI